jgi:hypothetical protein
MNVRANTVYTREAFDRQRAAAKKIEQGGSRALALFSVPFGFGQLLLIAWLDHRLGRGAVPIEGAVFLAYMAFVVLLLVRMLRRSRAARPTCPGCGARIEGLSERLAVATGRCDACGARVVELPA